MLGISEEQLISQMRNLRGFLDRGDFFESVDNLTVLEDMLKADFSDDVKLSSAVSIHKHVLYLRRYKDRFRNSDRKRGLRVSGDKVVQLLRKCGESIDPADGSDLATICLIIAAETLISNGEFDEALEILPHGKDRYLTFLIAECLGETGKRSEATKAMAVAKSEPTVVGYIEPNWDYLSGAADRGDVAVRARKIQTKRWLSSTELSLDAIVSDQILQWSGGPRSLIGRRDRIVTVGSCFALNLSYALTDLGMDSHALPFSEEINNTHVNRILFEGLLQFDDTGEDQTFQTMEISDIHDRISSSEVLIFTCGTSMGFFDKTGAAVIPGGTHGSINAVFFREHTVKKISVADNVRNLRFIIDAARIINPAIKIILTVSPVPLNRAFGVDSALIGDCVSKSTLRVAVDELLGDRDDGVYYWPSFEMAKWIMPHFGLGLPSNLFFGADDGTSRHPSKKMVGEIIGAFLKYSMIEADG